MRGIRYHALIHIGEGDWIAFSRADLQFLKSLPQGQGCGDEALISINMGLV